MNQLSIVFSLNPCKHSPRSKETGTWDFLKSNPEGRLIRWCRTCGHLQELQPQIMMKSKGKQK